MFRYLHGRNPRFATEPGAAGQDTQGFSAPHGVASRFASGFAPTKVVDGPAALHALYYVVRTVLRGGALQLRALERRAASAKHVAPRGKAVARPCCADTPISHDRSF